MKYRITILRSAQKELEAIPAAAAEKIEQKLLQLADDPRPMGCKKLKDREGAWRIRSGDYRIIYEIVDLILTVTVIQIGHRKDVYR